MGEGDKAYFKYLSVKNMRHPSNIFIKETPDGNLYGEESIFAGRFPVEEGCFTVSGVQVTADPSNTSIPMLRTAIRVEKPVEVLPVPIEEFFAMPKGFGRSWPAVNQSEPELRRRPQSGLRTKEIQTGCRDGGKMNEDRKRGKNQRGSEKRRNV